MGLNCT